MAPEASWCGQARRDLHNDMVYRLLKQGSEQQKSWEIDMMEEDDMDDDELVRVCAHSRGREGGRGMWSTQTRQGKKTDTTAAEKRQPFVRLSSCG